MGEIHFQAKKTGKVFTNYRQFTFDPTTKSLSYTSSKGRPKTYMVKDVRAGSTDEMATFVVEETHGDISKDAEYKTVPDMTLMKLSMTKGGTGGVVESIREAFSSSSTALPSSPLKPNGREDLTNRFEDKTIYLNAKEDFYDESQEVGGGTARTPIDTIVVFKKKPNMFYFNKGLDATNGRDIKPDFDGFLSVSGTTGSPLESVDKQIKEWIYKTEYGGIIVAIAEPIDNSAATTRLSSPSSSPSSPSSSSVISAPASRWYGYTS